MAEPITQLPSLRQLTYLLALQDHQHFGRAAAACAVTQSTLSSALSELERTLGAHLVERTRRSLRFTDVGLEVAQRARGVIRAAADLAEAARAARDPLVGPLRMAAIPTVAPFLLPRLFKAVAAAWPRLQLSVREMLTGAACEALQRNAVDCVLLALPVDCGRDVESFEILQDRLVLAMRGDDAAPQDAAVDPERLLLLDEGHCLREHALAACGLAAAPTHAPLVAATLPTLVQMVDAGLGVTLLPQIAVEAGVLRETGVVVRPSATPARRRIALAWRKADPRAPDLQLLGATIRDAMA